MTDGDFEDEFYDITVDEYGEHKLALCQAEPKELFPVALATRHRTHVRSLRKLQIVHESYATGPLLDSVVLLSKNELVALRDHIDTYLRYAEEGEMRRRTK